MEVKPVELAASITQEELEFCREILRAQGANVNKVDKEDFIPLHWAAKHGYIDAVKALLKKGAYVKGAYVLAKDKRGRTALHLASKYGHSEVVKILLANKANVNAVNDSSFTPLHYAAKRGNKEVILMLLAKGANATLKNKPRFNNQVHI